MQIVNGSLLTRAADCPRCTQLAEIIEFKNEIIGRTAGHLEEGQLSAKFRIATKDFLIVSNAN